MNELKKLFVLSWLALITALIAVNSQAQEGISIEERGYRVFYSVFNSTMLTPEIAEINGFVRDKDRALLNIVVTQVEAGSQSLGVPATLKGEAVNLMQQSQPLKFKEIREQNTVYYLAPVRHINEEMYKFSIEVTPEGLESPILLEFTKKLYVEL